MTDSEIKALEKKYAKKITGGHYRYRGYEIHKRNEQNWYVTRNEIGYTSQPFKRMSACIRHIEDRFARGEDDPLPEFPKRIWRMGELTEEARQYILYWSDQDPRRPYPGQEGYDPYREWYVIDVLPDELGLTRDQVWEVIRTERERSLRGQGKESTE